MADDTLPAAWNTPDGAAPLNIGMLLYPGFTLLDLAGPQTAFGLHGQTHLIWKALEPVPTDMGVSMNSTMTFADVPDNLDVLFVPGGFGTIAVMQDEEVLEFLAHAGSSARYVTSVCTGSVILGMAGLLQGYRAATHWAFYAALEALGIEASHERVAVDRNRISGGGVTAGIDFGLTVIAEIKGQQAAEFTQLALEYAPEPPFNAGHPRTAKPEIIEQISGVKGIGLAAAISGRCTARFGCGVFPRVVASRWLVSDICSAISRAMMFRSSELSTRRVTVLERAHPTAP